MFLISAYQFHTLHDHDHSPGLHGTPHQTGTTVVCAYSDTGVLLLSVTFHPVGSANALISLTVDSLEVS